MGEACYRAGSGQLGGHLYTPVQFLAACCWLHCSTIHVYIVAPPLLRLGREDSLCLISGALESIHFQFFLSLWDVSEQGKIE